MLPTKPDPLLVRYADHGEPGPLATDIFCAVCLVMIAVSVGWIIWMVAHAF